MASPKPQKTKAHHSSFIHRIHRRHDQRHHPNEVRHPEEQPLLQEDHPDSASETEMPRSEQIVTSPPKQRMVFALTKTQNVVRSATNSAITAITTGTSLMAHLGMKASTTTKSCALQATNAVRANPKRFLTALCGILIITTIGEGIDLYRHHHNGLTPDVCKTPACVASAFTILQSLNPSYLQMNPCDDFGSYVCGGFDQDYDLKVNQSQVSRQSLLFDDVRRFLRQTLDGDVTSIIDGEHEILDKARNGYKACKNEQKLREYGLKPLKGLTDDIKVLFASNKGTIRKTDAFQSALHLDLDRKHILTEPYLHMLKIGVETFVSFRIKPDAMFPDQKAIYVEPTPSFGFPLNEAEAFDQHETIREYQHIIQGVLSNFLEEKTNISLMLRPSAKSPLSLRDLAQGIVRLETRLNSILPHPSILMNMSASYNIMTYQEFDRMMPLLSASSIIQGLAPPEYNGTTLVLASPRHLQELSRALAHTPVQVLQAFCIWKVVQVHADRVEDQALEPWKDFSQKFNMNRYSQDEERWQTCIASVDADLGWIIARFLATRESMPRIIDVATTTVQRTQAAVRFNWPKHKWMTEQEQHAVGGIIDKTKMHVGYPTAGPNVMDFDSLSDYYRKVIILNDTFLENRIGSLKNRLYHYWLQLSDSHQSDSWLGSTALSGAYHDEFSRQAFFPVTLLHTSFLESSVPPYLHYSTLGVSSGHQFVNIVAHNMEYGHSNGSAWLSWSTHTENTLKRKTSCFKKQYKKYSLNGPNGRVYIDGKASLSKNIADAGAVNAAYQAWSQLEAGKSSLRLPGLQNFSQSQLFWLSYGTQMCSKMSSGKTQQQVLHGNNLPANIRIKGTVANSREFNEAFNCPVQDPVCELW